MHHGLQAVVARGMLLLVIILMRRLVLVLVLVLVLIMISMLILILSFVCRRKFNPPKRPREYGRTGATHPTPPHPTLLSAPSRRQLLGRPLSRRV